MKRYLIFGTLALILNTGFGQDIPQSQVPSLIVNGFQQSFPKAYDIEWEIDGELYKVEFETGLTGRDHDIWYDKAGKMIRHKEEITKSELPKKVSETISRDFNGYRLDDIKKITEGEKVIYTVELKSFREDWDVILDAEGNILSKKID